ncbi:hypothetical protein [Evansella vedderi]|uniref:hypothetical protein n=1 Tax=Evansella vedderi TaxID=38282 RepID=UPI0027D8E906|nr:hypothetical protein [Evansella vedderi]
MKIPLNLLAVFQLVFVTAFLIYYLYIGIQWGFGERLILLMASDGIYLLLILSSIGLFMGKNWSWWLTIIVYTKLLIAKAVTLIAETSMIFSGIIVEDFQIESFILEVFILFMYSIVIFFLSLPMVRSFFSIQWKGKKLVFLVNVSALIVYMLYFIVVVFIISWVQPILY